MQWTNDMQMAVRQFLENKVISIKALEKPFCFLSLSEVHVTVALWGSFSISCVVTAITLYYKDIVNTWHNLYVAQNWD